MSSAAAAAFESYFDRLIALVSQRLELEGEFHRLGHLKQLKPDLLELVREFGALLRVVYRYDLADALPAEAAWYAAVLSARSPGEDAFSLILDSWIMAIQGIIKPPECNDLAAPLQELRADLKGIFEEAVRRRGEPPGPDISGFVDRLILGDRAGAFDELKTLVLSGAPPYDLVPNLILPTMKEIGRRWEANELAIYEEHLATEIVIQLLAGLPALAPSGKKPLLTALASCVPNDHIQIQPMALSVYLELRGWRVISLGQGLPAEQIARAVQAMKPQVGFLSLAMLSRLSDALEVLDRLHEIEWRIPVIMGGRGAEQGRSLLEQAGAQVVSNFEEAHDAALVEVVHA